MTILALYVPKPAELPVAIAEVAAAYLVLCAIAFRVKLSVPVAAVLMALGCVVAIAPDIYVASRENLGSYGDTARELSNTSFSDCFFAITGYMHVGRGKLVAFAGMAIAIAAYASIVAFSRRIQRRE